MAAAKEKKLIVELVPNSGTLYSIRYEGGGQVPEFLKGEYTSYAEANRRITQYLTTEKRGAKNAKTTG
ncbi:hypothetical protein [Vibrio phage VP41s3]|nr:hypothetical protein [Vibrio phage VP41s3]